MKTVVLDARSPEETMKDILATLKSGKPENCDRFSFATPEYSEKCLWQSGGNCSKHCLISKNLQLPRALARSLLPARL